MTRLILLLFLSFFVACTSSKHQRSRFITKWDKASINVQAQTFTMFTRYEVDALVEKLKKDTSYRFYDEWNLRQVVLGNNYLNAPFSTGTAIYFTDHEKRYLLTAAHVIKDEVYTREQQQNSAFLAQAGVAQRPAEVKAVKELTLLRRYKSREYFREGFRWYTLGLESFGHECVPMEWSQEDDLAIISLDFNRSTQKFANTLDTLGFLPVTVNDINTASSFEIGSKITCVGFPNPSIVEASQTPFEGYARSLPIFSYGRIASNHDSLNHFWGDISIYPGNSGGPVIQQNKIIGIVSAQSTINVELDNSPTQYKTRIPFARLSKLSSFKRLFSALKEKEKRGQKCE